MESLKPFVPVGLLFSRTPALKTGRFASHFLQYLLQAPQYVHLCQAVSQISSNACLVEFGCKGANQQGFEGPPKIVHISPGVLGPLALCRAQNLVVGFELRVCRVVSGFVGPTGLCRAQ